MEQGLIPEPLPLTPANDPILSAMLWAAIILALVVFPFVVRLWGKFVASLTRHDDKLPAAERTLTDRLTQVAAIIVFCVMSGLLLYCVAYRMRGGDLALGPGAGVGLVAAGMFAAFLIQYFGCYVVGYAFSTTVDTESWTRALTIVTSMFAYWEMLPALGSMFYPSLAYAMAWLALAIFVVFHIFLWFKCFRIFYDTPFSIVYFFLYLCTLETVPLLLPVGIALLIC